MKVLHAALADDDAFLRRFRAEAQAAAALNHPNIIAVYDWGDDDGAPYLVTEYLGGGSLRAMLDRGDRLTPSQALLVGLEATRALDYAHRRGFVHRDIKPANLLFGEDGRLRIADFGLARALAEAAWTEPQGAVLGTARYASPEQAQGQPVDGKADVYSLGLVLIEAVTGTVPFAADTTIATLMARVDKPVEVPEALGPLAQPLARAGLPDATRPARRRRARRRARWPRAEDLPRPAPLPLVGAVAGRAQRRQRPADATMLGAALAGTRLADPDEPTVVGRRAPRRAAPPPRHRSGWPTTSSSRPTTTSAARRRWPYAILVAVARRARRRRRGLRLHGAQHPEPRDPGPRRRRPRRRRRAAAEELGFEVEIAESREDGSTPGTVLDTRPAAGEQLDEGDTLTLIVSLGNTPAPVPTDLVGKTARGGHPDPRRRRRASRPRSPSSSPRTSRRTSSSPLGEGVPAELPKGDPVPLIVSSGPAPRTVPSGLAGGPFDQAKAALEGVQLKAKQVEEFSDDVATGKVIRRRARRGRAGRARQRGDGRRVEGPRPRHGPRRSAGMSLDEAVGAIEGAGLVVGDAFGPANGDPFLTTPPAGTEVQPRHHGRHLPAPVGPTTVRRRGGTRRQGRDHHRRRSGPRARARPPVRRRGRQGRRQRPR